MSPFVIDVEPANVFTEPLTFQAKERCHDKNVNEALAVMSRSDGGAVLVGVGTKARPARLILRQ